MKINEKKHPQEPSEFRYERKTSVVGMDYFELLLKIKQHPFLFNEIYKERQVNSIYFDDPSFRNFLEHVDGACHRRKIRIRWYGELFGKVSGATIEIKARDGVVGSKTRFSVDEFELVEKGDNLQIKQIVQSLKASGELTEYVKYLNPTVITSYNRKYFLSADRRYRLTLDSNVVYYGIDKNYWISPAYHDSRLIMEFKYDIADESEQPGLFAGLPFRLSRNSKYLNAIQMLHL